MKQILILFASLLFFSQFAHSAPACDFIMGSAVGRALPVTTEFNCSPTRGPEYGYAPYAAGVDAGFSSFSFQTKESRGNLFSGDGNLGSIWSIRVSIPPASSGINNFNVTEFTGSTINVASSAPGLMNSTAKVSLSNGMQVSFSQGPDGVVRGSINRSEERYPVNGYEMHFVCR